MSPSPPSFKISSSATVITNEPTLRSPDENDHLISPQVYEDEPGFFNPLNSQPKDSTLILQKNKRIRTKNKPKEPSDRANNAVKASVREN
ncbi:hypothetical protein O181_029184 [Austropuccinia psidii MF-1]|uniref:Uncharacterized protein n=1 Tax=Austropuccinia psidii MF-1 TaxID=1389203 RepID=A0A9Q3CRX8_9BASI|nr:hypothetical protein [Austropuccinia psidii MF-1]